MSALSARITQLVAEHGLPEGSARRLRVLLDVLETDPLAPTTVTAPALALSVHLTDSLEGLRVPEVRHARHLVDIGSGAGFPGLVLAIAAPLARVTLLDSVGKKVAFMGRAAVAAGIENVETVHARAEEWSDGLGRQDVVTARAVAPLPVLVEYAAPLLTLGGRLVAWKGERDTTEEADAQAAAESVGLALAEVVAVPPRPAAEHRTLYVYSKVSPTPERYPRRPGMARKRPIAASPPG